MFVNIFVSKGEQKGEAYDVNSDFSRTDSKHHKISQLLYFYSNISNLPHPLPGVYIIADGIH